MWCIIIFAWDNWLCCFPAVSKFFTFRILNATIKSTASPYSIFLFPWEMNFQLYIKVNGVQFLRGPKWARNSIGRKKHKFPDLQPWSTSLGWITLASHFWISLDILFQIKWKEIMRRLLSRCRMMDRLKSDNKRLVGNPSPIKFFGTVVQFISFFAIPHPTQFIDLTFRVIARFG